MNKSYVTIVWYYFSCCPAWSLGVLLCCRQSGTPSKCITCLKISIIYKSNSDTDSPQAPMTFFSSQHLISPTIHWDLAINCGFPPINFSSKNRRYYRISPRRAASHLRTLHLSCYHLLFFVLLEMFRGREISRWDHHHFVKHRWSLLIPWLRERTERREIRGRDTKLLRWEGEGLCIRKEGQGCWWDGKEVAGYGFG